MKFTIVFLLIVNLIIAQEDKNNCEIIFSFNIHNNQLSVFNYKVISGSDHIVSFFWDFGDGYTSEASNPQHVFLHEGSYITCLTVVFENNCTATYCDTIEVVNNLLDPQQNFSISGKVYAGNALLPDGVVVLFKKNNNQYQAITYSKISQGIYSFTNLGLSQYLLYAIPYFNVNTLLYPNYFPTYYGDKLYWQDAIPITVTGTHTDKNIQLLSSTDCFIGNDSVFGIMQLSDSTYFEYNVYLNNWFDSILPPQEHLNLAPNQVILLADEKNNVQRFALTNHRGEFVFKNIPKEIIKLRPEKCGVAAQTISLELAEHQGDTITFVLNPNNITIDVNEINKDATFEVKAYPNPASSFVQLSIVTSSFEPYLTIELLDMQGNIIYNKNFSNYGKEFYLIPIAHLATGNYIVVVKGSKKIARQLIIKK